MAVVTYEATKDLPLETYEIPGWAGPVQVEKIAGKKITVVPILRAGIGMLEGVLGLILDVGGYYKNVITLAPSLEISYPEIDLGLKLLEQLLVRATKR